MRAVNQRSKLKVIFVRLHNRPLMSLKIKVLLKPQNKKRKRRVNNKVKLNKVKIRERCIELLYG